MFALIDKRQTVISKVYSYCIVPKFYPYINCWVGRGKGVGLVLGGVKKGE